MKMYLLLDTWKMLNWSQTRAAHLHGTVHGKPEQKRIRDDTADLIALFKQLKGCPMEEGLDLFGLVLEGEIWIFILDDSDGGQILA